MLQNELFYSYVDESDKEFMAIESAYDIDMAKSFLAIEYADRLYDIKCMQCDLKVLNESGTYDDLDALYEAAGKENGDRKQNIFKTIFEKIVKFLNDVWTSVKNLFTKNTEEELKKAADSGKIKGIQMKDPNKIISIVSGVMKKIGGFLKPGVTVTNEDGEKSISIVKSAITAIEGVGVVAIGAKAIPAIMDKLGKAKDSIALPCNGLIERPGLGDGWRGLANAVSDLSKELGKCMKDTASAVFNALKNVGSDIKQSASNLKDAAISKVKGAASKGEDYYYPATTESADDDDLGLDDEFLESEELSTTCDDILAIIDAM